MTSGERGRLRVYLGAAPGVGKTFAMLDEGHRRLARGTDVVVGYVETHGRPRTAEQLAGLEVVPRRSVPYRGTVQEEMDLDAVLARAPAVALVDELAHTNVRGAPGGGHEKRWQDVQTLLAAGIEVVTTVNIQHLESLNDVTEAITGVRQRETVPDHVVRAADQIELVDMSPQSLRRRMAHGNVYPADRVDAALSQYFREGNLTALRELALLWLADQVDEGLDRYRAQHRIDSTWAARERIVVPVSGGPESATLMRRAARIASRSSGAQWRALHVSRSTGLTAVPAEELSAMRRKAEELDGTLHTVVGDDTSEAILAFARAENATQITIGASRRGRVSTLLRPGVGERVVAGAGDIDVHIVSHDYARQGVERAPRPDHLGRRRRLLGLVVGTIGPVLVSLGLRPYADVVALPTEAMVLMVVVVATAMVGGLAPAVVAALVSGLLLNLLFTPPLYELSVAEPGNVLVLGLFMVVGIAVATVVDGAARRTSQAVRARAEADALTALAHDLLNASDDVPGLLASAGEVLEASGAALVRRSPGDGGVEEVLAAWGDPPADLASADATAVVDDRTTLALAGTDLPASRRGLLNAYAAYAGVMAERRRATEAEVERLRLTEADRTRTALLSAVSHDLRSPLAAVKAAVDSLCSPEVEWSPEDERELLETIQEATDRLIGLVTNLLDMSRVHTGSIRPRSAEVVLAHAVHDALAPLAGSARIEVAVDEQLVALADPGLLDRVLANVCENALKHTSATAGIRVDATALAGGRVVLRIADTGPGVGSRDRARLFDPFQRFGDVPRDDGVGLGLAVARGLTEAMGGTLGAEETPGGGLTFVLELPALSPALSPALEEELS